MIKDPVEKVKKMNKEIEKIKETEKLNKILM